MIYIHYYHTIHQGAGATRIDRAYFWGEIKVTASRYEPLAFSDHMAYIVTLSVPDSMSRIISPRSKPLFKIKPEVIRDKTFQDMLETSMLDWQEVRDLGLDVLTWWETMVKPEIKNLAIKRSKELNRERRGELNMLLLRKAYLAKQLQNGRTDRLGELRSVQMLIEQWYDTVSKKVLLKSRSDDVSQSEKVRIYHHDLHKKNIKRSYILKLQTENGLLEGHASCASYLESQVGDLLLNPAPLDRAARQCLLDEVVHVYTDQDNNMLRAVPDEK